MKKSFYSLNPATLVLAVVALFGWVAPMSAQLKPSDESGIPNLDVRVGAAKGPDRLFERNAGLNGLHQRLPGADVSFDPLFDSPRFVHARSGFLTGPNGLGRGTSATLSQGLSANDPYLPVRSFLAANTTLFGHGAEVLDGAALNRDSIGQHNGLRTVVWQQKYLGLPVFNAVLIGNTTARGELVTLGSHFLPNLASAAAGANPEQFAVSAPQAIASALANLGSAIDAASVVPSGASEAFDEFMVAGTKAYGRKVWLPMDRNSMRLAWEICARDLKSRKMFQLIVDGQTGQVLVRRNLTSHISDATYNVYTSDSPSPFSPAWPTPVATQPPFVNRTLLTLSAVDVQASPDGWINDADNETQGNNVDTFVDRDFDQNADGPRAQGTARTFDFPIDFTLDPVTYTNASSVQLFYLVNRYHDLLYRLGFTEAAGNFQNNNFGRGGLGNDRVITYVQSGADAGQADNAFFSTPPDGINGEMFMFIFDFPNPQRDGSLDAEVVWHEATHGTSTRLVGGGVLIDNLQTRGMGEGWSDFVALSLLSEPADDPDAVYASGGYVTYQFAGLQANYYFGIRHFPYTTDMSKNPFTFRDIDPGQISGHLGVARSVVYPYNALEANEVHHQGEIWCSALWEARANLIRRHGFSGNQTMLQLVIDGMKLGPANPTFLEARDAILLADEVNNGGVNTADIWAGFAKRGMGVSAGSPLSDTTIGVVEGFDTPGLQLVESSLSGGNGNGIIDINECNQLDLVLKNNSATPATGITVQLGTTTPGVAFGSKISTYPTIPVGFTATNAIPFAISTSPNFICGTPIVLTILIKSDQTTSQLLLTLPTGTNGPAVRFDNSTPAVIPDGSAAGTNSSIVVSNITSAVSKVTVALSISHTWDADLTIQLISPDGTTNTLSRGNGASGDNYGVGCQPDNFRTFFDDDAATAISAANAPFVGTFRPQESLAIFNGKAGTNVNGTWKLRVVDSSARDSGTLNCWSLFLSSGVCVDGGGGCAGADLSLGITDTPDPVFIGSNLVYTISVTNVGPGSAKNTVVTHQLPPSVIFVSATSSQGSCVNAAGTVVCSLGIVPLESRATIRVTVQPTVVGTLSSTATITSSESDPDSGNNSATTLAHVNPPTTELSVGLFDAPDPALVGNPLAYTVSVTNGGPSTASGVLVTNTLPPSVVVQSAGGSQGSFLILGNEVIFNVGSLTNGGRFSGTINATPTALGTFSAVARVSANQTDPVVANNTSVATTVVGPASDLVLSIVDSPDPVVIASSWTYTVSVTNRGPSIANNTVVNFALPVGITLVSTNVSQGTLIRQGSTITANFGTLAGGEFAILTVVVKANNGGSYAASASVSSSSADPNTANNSAAATTTVAPATVQIVAAGAALTAESQLPPNGAIDLNETVTLTLRLRNAGNILPNAGLTAVLLATNGVSLPSGPQAYPAMGPSEVPVGRPFTFTVTGASGGTINPTLLLLTNGSPLGLVSYSFQLPFVYSFSNSAAVSILDAKAASPYPSVINVSGITGVVGRVSVTLSNLSHSYVEDVDALVVNPAGHKVILMSDAGRPNGVVNTTVTFADGAPPVPEDSQILATTYAPGNYQGRDVGDDVFPGPAPVGPYSTSLSAFNDATPNGNWSLYLVDDHGGDAGNLANGWRITVTTISPINQIADVAMSVAGTVGPTQVGNVLTYVYTITNSSTVTATGLTFTNPLPPGTTLVSATASQGLVTTNAAGVSANFTSLASGTNITVIVTLIGNNSGSLANSATVSALENDLNLANNTAAVSTALILPVADLGLAQTIPAVAVLNSNVTLTLFVTNQGPQTALGVQVVDTLPAGFTFISGTASLGSVAHADNVVTATLGNLASGGSATVEIIATATLLGSQTNAVLAVTSSADTNTLNNAAEAEILVENPAPHVVAAGVNLLSESFQPPNVTIESNETVRVELSLRNTGSLSTAGLVATLLPTGGVTDPSSAHLYGAVVAGGAPVSRVYTFTAEGTNGGTIIATLDLQEGGTNRGTVSFAFELPVTGTFANTNRITIPDHGAATPYASTIEVTGLTGLVSKVTVNLSDLTHGFPDDLDVLLVSPSGQKVILMSDVGGSSSLTNVNLTFDEAAGLMPDISPITLSQYAPTDFEANDYFPAPAPAGEAVAALSAFNGIEANGNWSLYVMDDNNGDGGLIAGGWSLTITTVNPLLAVADLSVQMSAAPDPVFVGNALTYTITVTNRGPLAATGVTLTDDLPPGLQYVASTASQGSVNVAGLHVAANVGSLASGAGAVVTVRTVAEFSGNYTNSAVVTGAQSDLNLVNNSAVTTARVNAPQLAEFKVEEVTVTNGELQATLVAQPGLPYVILGSTNLIDWVPVSTNIADVNGNSKVVISDVLSTGMHFYRAMRQIQ